MGILVPAGFRSNRLMDLFANLLRYFVMRGEFFRRVNRICVAYCAAILAACLLPGLAYAQVGAPAGGSMGAGGYGAPGPMGAPGAMGAPMAGGVAPGPGMAAQSG